MISPTISIFISDEMAAVSEGLEKVSELLKAKINTPNTMINPMDLKPKIICLR
jgi:hypothetical protein